MPAALIGRGWKGSSAAILGRGDLRARGSGGGQILGRSYGSPPPAALPGVQQPFSPLARRCGANCEQIAL